MIVKLVLITIFSARPSLKDWLVDSGTCTTASLPCSFRRALLVGGCHFVLDARMNIVGDIAIDSVVSSTASRVFDSGANEKSSHERSSKP